MEEDDLGSVILTLDDDTELECSILCIYPVGDKEYIALLPMNDDSDEVLIYRFIDNGEDQDPELENIEDDDEYDAAVDAFDEILDEDEFDEF
ncbi:MAG TPA: DUF1292 domain-containing protein [Lachnospiraceae bacterium]|nr:DUF1292 domain-containing protein [Lachnospiraceae bacterium]HAV27298.1 DUF1292 domain-containing protein [Lachnospiraceae bacterium]